MKHLLNDLSEEEKNRIREQHTGGKKLVIENFDKLVNGKLGDTKPLLSEQKENEKCVDGEYYVGGRKKTEAEVKKHIKDNPREGFNGLACIGKLLKNANCREKDGKINCKDAAELGF